MSQFPSSFSVSLWRVSLFRNKTANVVISDVVHSRLSRHPLLWKCDSCLRYTRVCNFVGASKKSTTFPTLMFTKFINSQQHYVQISYSDFHQNWTIYASLNVRTEARLHSPAKYDFYSTDFRERHINHPVSSVDIICARLYPYRKKKCRWHSNVLFTPRSKVCLALHRFSRNSHVLENILYEVITPNFVKIRVTL
jgi:hypothetical protein